MRQRTASGAYQVKQGGILTQAKNPARIATTHIGYTQEEQELYDSQRNVTARVPVNAGKVDGNDNEPEALIIENSYCGQSKDRESTLYCNRYLRTLFHVAASRGELPVAICMDTNLPYRTHAVFQQLMAEGDRVDAAVLQQAQDGKPIEPTYSLNSNFEDKTAGNITTIDAILLNRTAAQLFQKFWLTETAGITSHKQLHLSLNMAHYSSPIDVLQIPKPFPIVDIQPMDDENQERLANTILDKYLPDINKEYEGKQPEQVNSSRIFQLICQCWEEYITCRLKGVNIANSMKGRGGKPERKETTLAAVTTTTGQAILEEDAQLKALRKVHARTKDWLIRIQRATKKLNYSKNEKPTKCSCCRSEQEEDSSVDSSSAPDEQEEGNRKCKNKKTRRNERELDQEMTQIWENLARKNHKALHKAAEQIQEHECS